MTETYEEILSRVPEVTWTMPADRPEYAASDPYMDQALRTAGRIVYLAQRDSLDLCRLHNPDFEPPAEHLASEVMQLRALLFRDPDREPSPWDALRIHVLDLLGIRRTYASSSRAAEQPLQKMHELPEAESESDTDVVPLAEIGSIREWVGRGPVGH